MATELDRAVAAYQQLHPQLTVASDAFMTMVREIIDEAGINYLTVEGRAKAVASFAGKAMRFLQVQPDGDPLVGITDQVGVRVIT